MTIAPEDDPFAEFAPPEPKRRMPKRNQWGWYADLPPVPGHGKGPWPNVTTISDTLSDKYALGQWQQRQILFALADDADLLEYVRKTTSRRNFDPTSDTGKRTLNNLVEHVHEAAGSRDGANIGTLFHEFSEDVDKGADPRDLGLDEKTGRMLAAYVKLRKRAGIQADPEFVERVVFIPELGAAGTLDRRDLDKDGTPRITDVKTQKWAPDMYSGISIPAQLASYAHASHILNHDTWTWDEMPPVDQTMGLVYWVPAIDPGHAEIFEIDLVKGWRLARASVKTREWRKDKSTVKRRTV